MSPASVRPSPLASTGAAADLSRVSAATLVVGVLVLSAGETTAAPVGPVPAAVAVLSTEPRSTSAWLIV